MKHTDEELMQMGLTQAEIEALHEDEDEGNDDDSEGGDDESQGGGGDGDGQGDAGAGAGGDGDGKQDGGGDATAAGDAGNAGNAGTDGSSDTGANATATNGEKPSSNPPPQAQAEAAPNPRIAAIDGEMKKLRADYNSGELTFEEYEEARDRLASERDDLRWQDRSVQLRNDIKQQDAAERWYAQCSEFVAQHSIYAGGMTSLPMQALNHAVIELQKEAREAGKPELDPELLRRAHERITKEFGVQAAAPAADGGGKQPAGTVPPVKMDKPAIPPSLATVPAAQLSETDNSKWAWLDRLAANPNPDDPDKFEREMAKLSPSERAEYLAAG